MKNTVKIKDNYMRRTQMICYIAALAAISIVLNIVEITLGGGSFKLSLSYLPSFVAGMFLGPLAGFSVGLVGDVIGVLIVPQGPWIPLVTLSSSLIGLIPGLIFMIKKIHPFIKLSVSLVLVFFICTAGLNSLGIYLAYIKGKQAFLVWWSARVMTQSIVVFINALILFAIYYPLNKIIFARLKNTHVTDLDIEIESAALCDNSQLFGNDYICNTYTDSDCTIDDSTQNNLQSDASNQKNL